MNNDNGFDLLKEILFGMIPQLGGIRTKNQGLVTIFQLIDGE